MKIRMVFIALLFSHAASAVPVDHHIHLAAADNMVRSEPQQWQHLYHHATTLLNQADGSGVSRALAEYQYLALEGSGAAATRLCWMQAYGIGISPRPIDAMFWCQRSARAGYAPAAALQQYLFQTYWKEWDEE
jgi:TPR repeat protein